MRDADGPIVLNAAATSWTSSAASFCFLKLPSTAHHSSLIFIFHKESRTKEKLRDIYVFFI